VTGRLVLPGSAPETEWLEARRHGITASEISIVMGLSPYSSPFALYHRKTGALPQEEDKAVFERGHVLEPYIAEKFAERRPEFIVDGDGRSLYAHTERPWQMATPDRLVWERDNAKFWPGGDYQNLPDAVLECKTDAGEDAWGDEGSDDIPVHYRAQVLWQMDVMGVSTAFVACLLMRQWKVRLYELTLDAQAETDLKLMRDEARDFLDRIDLGDPPDVDWRPATTDALNRLHPSVEDRDVPVGRQLMLWYQAACRDSDAAERRKAKYANRLREVIGGGHRALCGGVLVATRSVYEQSRIDTGKLRENYPDAAAACAKTSTVSKLLPAKPKEKP
jgi:putative phage-type endonuclease